MQLVTRFDPQEKHSEHGIFVSSGPPEAHGACAGSHHPMSSASPDVQWRPVSSPNSQVPRRRRRAEARDGIPATYLNIHAENSRTNSFEKVRASRQNPVQSSRTVRRSKVRVAYPSSSAHTRQPTPSPTAHKGRRASTHARSRLSSASRPALARPQTWLPENTERAVGG